MSLVDVYMHSGTRLLDFASDSPVDFGLVINLQGLSFLISSLNGNSSTLARRCSL